MDTGNQQIHTHIGTGIGAGFVATIVLSIFMVVKQMMGLMPQLNPVEMNTQMMGAQTPLVGWIVHFLIGTFLWGILYALIAPRLPGAHWFRGILFATGAWLLMMITLMPMAGAGLFGLKMGLMAPIATLILHWIYGAVLGGLYGTWSSRQERGEPVLGVGTHAHR
jgi:uncharacterized membrane protein YagU involved in acid resistance